MTAKTAKPAAKTATGKKATGNKATGKKARPTGVTRRTAAATDIPGKTQAGDRSADNVVTDRVSVSGASGRKKAARKTAQNRAGRTARSKEAALKEMAQQHLVAKRTGEAAGDVAAKRSAEEAGRADKAALEAMLKTRRADKVGQAGQGVIWSLLALGLAACGGGTNTIRVAGGPVEELGIRRPARGDEPGIRRPAGRKPERPCRASQ